jgi:hypothetical protein
MAPDVVMGALLSNRPVLPGRHGLEDLTVEILARYGVAPGAGMTGHRVLGERRWNDQVSAVKSKRRGVGRLSLQGGHVFGRATSCVDQNHVVVALEDSSHISR